MIRLPSVSRFAVLAADNQLHNDTFLVEEILARTDRATLQKIYDLPEFSNTLEFLTMLALSSGRLLKVTFPHPRALSRVLTHSITGWHP